MAEERTNNGYKITIFILVLIIAGLVFDKVSQMKQKNNLIDTIETVSFEKDSLQGELNDLYLTYSTLQTNNEELNDSLAAQRDKVQELMEQLKHVKSNDYARIQQLKAEVETLKNIMKSYVRQIDSLYQANQILIAENTQIKTQYTQVIEEKQDLIQEKDSLQQTVNIAKELTIYSSQVSALNKRGKTTERIKKAKKIQICFLLSENKVVSTGRKYIYLRVAKPDGEILRNNNSGFFDYQGKSIAYSSVKEIEYDGSSQNICMYYNIMREDLPKGTYSLFLFVDGHQIGDAKITLK